MTNPTHLKSPEKFPFKETMDTPKSESAGESCPCSGTTSPAGKSSEPDAFKYRFSTTNPVTTAKFVPDAHKAAVALQEGANRSKLPKIASDGTKRDNI